MLYKKKPVVIEAVIFDDTEESVKRIREMAGEEKSKQICWYFSGHRLTIPTLEGTMSAHPGDYIIKGVQGEIYPCKPDIFVATYEPVTNVNP